MTRTATTTTFAMDNEVDNTRQDNGAANDDDDAGDDASSTTSNDGDNRNRDNGKDSCALTATTPAHRPLR